MKIHAHIDVCHAFELHLHDNLRSAPWKLWLLLNLIVYGLLMHLYQTWCILILTMR